MHGADMNIIIIVVVVVVVKQFHRHILLACKCRKTDGNYSV